MVNADQSVSYNVNDDTAVDDRALTPMRTLKVLKPGDPSSKFRYASRLFHTYSMQSLNASMVA